MTEDTRNVRDAFAAVSTERLLDDPSVDDGYILQRLRTEAVITELSDANAELAAQLRLYQRDPLPVSRELAAFVSGAVFAALVGLAYYAVARLVTAAL